MKVETLVAEMVGKTVAELVAWMADSRVALMVE